MSMVIGTNISSLTAQRHLETSRSDLNQSMERLSSGLRINSAMDDAAGLAISDRMDSQVNGLSQAVRNANDAISLGQTAEGALGETTAILQRMRDLSVQSGNATNTTADRTALQTEVATLQAELTRISTASTFNNTALLDGSFTSGSFQIGHMASDTTSLSIAGMGAADLNKVDAVTAVTAVTATAAQATLTFTGKAVAGNNTSVTVGSATLSYDFVAADFATTGSETVTEAATAFTSAWNASTDAAVSALTATSSAGVVTFAQDVAATGALNVSVTNSAVAGTSVATTIAAGADGVVAVAETKGTATLTIATDPAAVTDSNTVTIGDAVFTYNADSADISGNKTTYAASFVAAWNAETGDDEVAKYTATSASAVITFTQDTAYVTNGAISISETGVGTGAASIAAAGISGVAAITAVKGTAVQTFTAAAAANETLQTTVGSATFSYDFGSTAMTSATATAAAYATAWNASGDSNVALFTAAANSSGVITYTQDATATATNVAATMNATLAGAAIKDGDTLSVTAGSGTLAHTFTTSGLTLTANTDQYVAAWNASTDADVSLYTASNVAGVITITEDTATTGALAVAATATQVGAGSDISVGSIAAATTGISALTVGSIDNGHAVAVSTVAATTTGQAAVTGVTGVTGSSVNTLDISTASGATAAIASIDLAIAEVGAERAKLGAFQNRLDYTVSNLSSMIENTSAARSRIQDADFAVESANLAKNQVMQQAGTAMLAQANASSQGVLSLLK